MKSLFSLALSLSLYIYVYTTYASNKIYTKYLHLEELSTSKLIRIAHLKHKIALKHTFSQIIFHSLTRTMS